MKVKCKNLLCCADLMVFTTCKISDFNRLGA
jgi:hypothetical protein